MLPGQSHGIKTVPARPAVIRLEILVRSNPARLSVLVPVLTMVSDRVHRLSVVILDVVDVSNDTMPTHLTL